MANPTTNFGWQMPTSTDLVTDLPADFEVFGQAVDTDFVDLLGGTTGQILSKTSATDLDFTWVSANPGDITGVTAGTGISGGGTSGDVTVTNSMATAIDAKGDLIAGTGADAFSRLAIGTNNHVLTADSAQATGMKWASASATKSYALISTTTLTAASTITVSGLGGYDDLLFMVTGWTCGTATSDLTARFNADSGSNYLNAGFNTALGATYDRQMISALGTTTGNAIALGTLGSIVGGGLDGSASIRLNGANSTGFKAFTAISGTLQSATSTMVRTNTGQGIWANAAQVTSMSVISSAGNFTAGTLRIYGAV